MAKTFVLVGDHYQLPPLVRNKEAVEGGLDVSLFRLLSEAHPEAVAMLDSQYRMSADIMSLSNELIYNGRLKCGDQDIARQVLNIPNQTALQSLHHHTETSSLPRICPGPTSSSCHLARTLEPCNRVLFLDTDPLGTDLETAQGSRITNDTEARLISQLAASLLAAGIRPADIGVVSFYRSQLALLRSYFHTAGSSASTQSSGFTLGAALGLGAVELSTADKFQGRDMDVVVVSFVRSNENSLLGDLLKDYRRINVALTRAKKKLVLVGSGKTLKTNVLLGKLVGICEERGWVHQLSEEGLKGHVLESSAFGLGMVTQKGRRIMPSPSPKKQGKSPEKKTTSQPESLSQPNRRVLGDVSSNPKAKTPRNSQGIKKPGNVAKLGRRGLLGSRPLLRDVLNDIM
jgi:DNA replication ATP-dependent helicase Dna2